MKNNLGTSFEGGQKVRLYDGFNTYIVEVVEQSPQKLITTVKDIDSNIDFYWSVMTYRLTKID